MGRAFEFRKARKLKRWGQMSKTFTKIGREIAKAVKDGGASLETNARLRVLVQNAKSANMPKDTIERAIQKATHKNTENWEERVYEGYAPYGIAVLVETLTDNSTRTVANVRACFNKWNGTLGTTGSLDFAFERKCMFKVEADRVDVEAFTFEMIDYGAEEIERETDQGDLVIYGQFQDFGAIQGALEAKNMPIKEAGLERIPTTTKKLAAQEEETVHQLIGRLEEDDDVQAVFHTMA